MKSEPRELGHLIDAGGTPPDLPDIARGAIKSNVVWLATAGLITAAQAEDIIARLGLGDA